MEHDPFVREGAYGSHVVLHCEVDVGCAGAVLRAFFLEFPHNLVVKHGGETPPGAEFRKQEFVFVRDFKFGIQHGQGFRGIDLDTFHPVPEFGDYCKYGNLVQRNLVKEVGHFYPEVAF